MSQLTIRGVDGDLQQLLKREAAQRNQSIYGTDSITPARCSCWS